MSGEPPQGFEKHESRDLAENLTDGRLAEEIGEWFGSTGILDMRAYLRFRLLDYFKNRFLPGERCSSEVQISKEEIALNTLVLDFALRHRYYFTVCLLLSEIQAFSKFDEKLTPLMKRMSSMTTEQFENLTPLLDRKEISTILHSFGINPDHKIGKRILEAYTSKDRGSSLIQLILSSSASSWHADETDRRDETESNSFVENDQQIRIMDDWIKNINDQIVGIKLKVEQLEYQRACSREEEWFRSSEMKFKELSGKYDDVIKEVDKVANGVQILTELLETIRVHGESAMKRCMLQEDLTFDLKRNLNILEVSVARMRRRLVSESRKSKRRVIKRRLLRSKRRRYQLCAVERPPDLRYSDKSVQTDVMGRSDVSTSFPRPVNNLSGSLKSSAIQTDISHPATSNGRCDSSLENKERLISFVGDRWREEVVRTTPTRSFRNQSVSTELATTQSLFTEQNVAAISDQNLEYKEKVVHQAERIRCLTAAVAKLLAEIGRTDPDATPRKSLRDACVNTDKGLRKDREKELRAGHARQPVTHHQLRVSASPLIAAVKSARCELAALKRERWKIEGE